MQVDRSVSLRIPPDLAAKLDSKLDSILKVRKPGDKPPPGRDAFRVRNLSDLIRHALSLGLALNERDPDLMADLKAELLADELRAILASAASGHAPTLKLLKKIAATSPTPEPDFG